MAVMGRRELSHSRPPREEIAAMRAIVRRRCAARRRGLLHRTHRQPPHRGGRETPPKPARPSCNIAALRPRPASCRSSAISICCVGRKFRSRVRSGRNNWRAPAAAAVDDLAAARPGGDQWKAVRARVVAAVAAGLPLYHRPPRGIGGDQRLDASFHPFVDFPATEVARLPLAERAAALARRARKARILSNSTNGWPAATPIRRWSTSCLRASS
jgi:hypothetical protein